MKVTGSIVLCLVLLAAGCSSMSVDYDYEPSMNFAKLRTYDWGSQPDSLSGGAKEAIERNSLTDERIKNALTRQLAGKGMKLDPKHPDFLVVWHIGVENKVNVRPYGYSYRYRGTGAAARKYREGTLIVDFVDPKTKQLMWRGIARDVLPLKSTPQKSEKLINEAAEKILAGFPPNK